MKSEVLSVMEKEKIKTAAAKVLFGEVSPSGKLPVTFFCGGYGKTGWFGEILYLCGY